MEIPVGVANSVSANFEYDPIDALKYAHLSEFDLFQLFVTPEMISDDGWFLRAKEYSQKNAIRRLYLHGSGYFSPELVKSGYFLNLCQINEDLGGAGIVLHFDEDESLDTMLKAARLVAEKTVPVYLENYFKAPGSSAAEKNLRKYQAVFTLLPNQAEAMLRPVLDIPRFFHQNLAFQPAESLNWCFQMINFFNNRRLPLLLHLLDCHSAAQERNSFCALGSGQIPYRELFQFIRKTAPAIEGIIFEFEDKINPLKSREFLQSLYEN
ncbi:MAG: hypothetical protein Kow0037_16230 [Calditrichia bacterium]